MFRNGLRRCAIQAKSVASTSFVQSRTALHFPRRLAISSPAPSLSTYASFSRHYSSEAVAQNATETTPATSELSSFSQLQDLGVHENLVHAVTKGMGYETMTPVQAKTITPALKGTDIVAQAKTGTGKTLAFLLPMLQRMIQEDPYLASRGARRDAQSSDIRGIVLSPTRELAEQIAVEARRLTASTGLVVQCAVGGTDKRRMLQMTRRNGCHLLVATPGRLNDLLEDSSSGIDAPNLAALVLDEADRMLDVGFERELNEIIGRLPSPQEKTRQTMLVSATIPDNVIRLARTMVRPENFEFVQTIPENESLTHDKIPQHIVPVSGWSNVFPTLYELIDRGVAQSKEDNGRPFKAIVYLNTTSLVDLAGQLTMERHRNSGSRMPTFVIQSKLTQIQRQRAADNFRKAKTGILISSDVTARGMDFPDVTHVIQIDVPRERESYIHRLGRTGRQNKEGEGWLIMPNLSMSAGRKMLRGLPIQQNTSLESAETDVESSQTTKYHDEVKDLLEVTPRGLLGQTYTSMFGVSNDKEALAEDLSVWTQYGWGWSKPPGVSSRWAHNLGIARARGLNIEERRSSREDSDGGFRSRSPRSSDNDDPFNSMRTHIRSDDRNNFNDNRRGRSFNRGDNNRGDRRGGSNSRW